MKTYKQYPKAPGKRKADLKPNTYYRSWLKNKKLVIRVKRGNLDKVVHFGFPGMMDYTQHRDEKRRRSYLSRSAGITDKNGNYTKNDPFSANYHSRRKLWLSNG